MAKLSNLKRLNKEDFDQDDQAIAEQLATILNPLLDQLSSAFNKNINNENLSRENITFDVTVNSSGIPKIDTKFKTNLTSRLLGMKCIKLENLNNIQSYPTGCPFLTWTTDGNIITVKHITGLLPDVKYRVTMELIS